jgi:hypothetical protein
VFRISVALNSSAYESATETRRCWWVIAIHTVLFATRLLCDAFLVTAWRVWLWVLSRCAPARYEHWMRRTLLIGIVRLQVSGFVQQYGREN